MFEVFNMERLYEKDFIIDNVWQISKYHSQILYSCECLAKKEEGHAALILLFNILEMAANYAIFSDYVSDLRIVLDKCRDEKIINDVEFKFLNNDVNSIRKLRNILIHKNVAIYNVVFNCEKCNVLYPLDEATNNLTIYEKISKIIFNIIYKMIMHDQDEGVYKNNFDADIISNQFEIVKVNGDKLLEYKGIKLSDISKINQSLKKSFLEKNPSISKEELEKMVENRKIVMAQNSSDVNMLVHIYKQMIIEN